MNIQHMNVGDAEYACILIRLEIDNARLEATTKQQSNKIDALQKGAQESAMVSAQKTCFIYLHTPFSTGSR